MEIPKEWLSDYQKDVLGDNNYVACEKLVPNLRNKERYWIHYRNLKFALSEGLRLTKVHRVIEYAQEAWMAPYIAFNTAMRAKARSDFEKDLYKLKNNAVFGKTMENLRERRDIQALRPGSMAYKKWVASPSYKQRIIVGDGSLIIAERAKGCGRAPLLLNKPVYTGVAVLDLSKLHMQSFWYTWLKPRFGDKVSLCYTDTDSLVYGIESERDPSDILRGDTPESMFDNSDYPKGHPLHSDVNKKVLGKFKDEAKGVAIAEFVGLRPKLYAMRLDGDELAARGDEDLKLETKKSKGTAKAVVKKQLTFQSYAQCLESGVSQAHSQCALRSRAHEVHTERVTKVSLSAFDSKRCILADGIGSMAHGHYKLPR